MSRFGPQSACRKRRAGSWGWSSRAFDTARFVQNGRIPDPRCARLAPNMRNPWSESPVDRQMAVAAFIAVARDENARGGAGGEAGGRADDVVPGELQTRQQSRHGDQ